jgi:4-hydroxy-tetrahydrodipicolinate synthase
MSENEKRELLRCAVKCADGDILVFAGIGGNNTADCIKMAEYAGDTGADAVLCVTPYYNKCTKKGLLAHFRAVADVSPLPVILYNVPSRTNVNITAQLISELAVHPNITGIKEASGSIEQTTEIIDAANGNMSVYSGCDELNTEILTAGGVGVISVLANIAPAFVKKTVSASLNKNHAEAHRLQWLSQRLISALFCEVNPIPVKTAMRYMGFKMGPFRLPLCEMEDEHISMLLTEMKDFGLL